MMYIVSIHGLFFLDLAAVLFSVLCDPIAPNGVETRLRRT